MRPYRSIFNRLIIMGCLTLQTADASEWWVIPPEAFQDIRPLFQRPSFNPTWVSPEAWIMFAKDAPYNIFWSIFILPMYFDLQPDGSYRYVGPLNEPLILPPLVPIAAAG